MKKYTILLMLCLAFSYVKAQTILVNSNVISVNEDITFPFWLDSMSTVEIGNQVVSISALEFNIVPVPNGNSLVFVQTKIITSQETVPNGKTWKLEGVLLDSTVVNNSSGGQIVVSGSGGNIAVALSEQSASTMDMGGAMLYCDSLQEGGYDNWVLPTLEEIMFLSSGGSIVNRYNNKIWSSTESPQFDEDWSTVNLVTGKKEGESSGANNLFTRCVRHESVAVSGSSSPSGSNTPSTLGSGMPTMISNESASIMNWGEAVLYCDSLSESGYSDWIMPTMDQLTYAISGGCVIPDSRTSQEIWTRTSTNDSPIGSVITIRANLPIYNSGAQQFYERGTNYDSNPGTKFNCRCIR